MTAIAFTPDELETLLDCLEFFWNDEYHEDGPEVQRDLGLIPGIEEKIKAAVEAAR